MADNEPVPTPMTPNTNQVSTSDLEVKPIAESAQADKLFNDTKTQQQTASDAVNLAERGAGTEGEEVVWEATYSMKNFMVGLIVRVLLTLAWFPILVNAWGLHRDNFVPLAIVTGVVLGILWLSIIFRMIRARYGHYFRLTNRRLFISTGLVRRERQPVELIRVDDVRMTQTLMQRWLSLGTVMVFTKEKGARTYYILGVDNPKHVLDLVWHYARAERDHRSVMVDRV